jgi:hypothetical protein
MFLHADFGHIFSNMLGLFFFGPMLEQVWGSKRFTIFYFITGIGAGLLFSGINYFEASKLRDAVAALKSSPSPESLELFLSDRGLLSQGDNFLKVFEDNPTDPSYIRGISATCQFILRSAISRSVGWRVGCNFWHFDGIWIIISKYRTYVIISADTHQS